MSSKTLTISIAAYNVESYIHQLLTSIVAAGVMEDLEIFILDDGGEDGTLGIARQYEKNFPDSVQAVHKENGGWGSTVNWSVERATGKYFKLVDGDDWIDPKGLKKLVHFLKTCQSEAVVTQAQRVYSDGSRKTIYPFCRELNGKMLAVNGAVAYANVAIWGYTFLTEVVKENLVELPGKCFYTDKLYLFSVLRGIKRINYLDETVYFYRMGIEEQSTSRKSIQKHYKELIKVDEICFEKYEEWKFEKPEASHYLLQYLAFNYSYTISMLLCLPNNRTSYRELVRYEHDMRLISKEIYDLAGNISKKIKWLRNSGYQFYWFYPLYCHLSKSGE